MKTNKPYTANFKDYGSITVPAGTRVTNRTAMGVDPNYHFVDEFGWAKRDYPTIYRLLVHDLTYYGLNIPTEFVDKD